MSLLDRREGADRAAEEAWRAEVSPSVHVQRALSLVHACVHAALA